jgi:hypothetical protein
MSSGSSKNAVYAAAQGREFLRGELKDKPNEWVRQFAGLVDDRDTLDILNYYCSLWNDVDEDFLETRLARMIIRSASTRSIDEAFQAGNVSQLQGMVGLTNQQSEGSEVLSDAAERLENEGAIGLMLGPPGAGKTALTLDIARTWAARTGGHLIGNTSWDGFDEVVTSDTELLEYMASVEGPVLAVIDETAQELSGFGAGNKDAEAFSDALTFIRKREADHGPHAKRGSVLMVNHTRTKTAKPFRDLCTFAVEKPSRSDPGKARLLDSEGGKDTFDELTEYKGITDTRESYAEHEASAFEIHGEGDDEEDGGGPSVADVQRRERVRQALVDTEPWNGKDAGLSYVEAGEKAGYSDSWVSDRIKEWRRGEWSDLDDVPEPEVDDAA